MEHRWHRAFTEHPRSVGESYAEHFLAASRFGLRLLKAGLACLMHAILPGCFETTASRAVAGLADDMEARRRRAQAPVYAVTAAIADSSSSSASLHRRSRS